MKKLFVLIISFVCILITPVHAMVIEGNVSMSDKVPEELFGSWKVASVCTKATDKELIGTKSLDLWVLGRIGQVISLSNPLSGAKADISVNDVKGQTVKFEKRGLYPDEESVETPILTLQGDKFFGTDTIVIKTYRNGELIKEDYVEYQVRGTRISGFGIPDIFGK